MKFKCPLIVVEDINRSRKFYENILGQEVTLDFGANITFKGDFSLQSKSSWINFIDLTENGISSANNFELYFEEDNFDEFVEGLGSEKINYLHGVKEFPWGQRVIRFYDPDMHIIEVGESMKNVVKRFIKQGLSVEETAECTQHPIEFVKQCLEVD